MGVQIFLTSHHPHLPTWVTKRSTKRKIAYYLAMGHSQWYDFGVGAPPHLVDFSGWIGMFTGGTGF